MGWSFLGGEGRGARGERLVGGRKESSGAVEKVVRGVGRIIVGWPELSFGGVEGLLLEIRMKITTKEKKKNR